MKKIFLIVPLLMVISAASAQTATDMPHQKMWNSVDNNHDGKISRQEALAKASRHFDRVDTNKDGYISKEEMQAARSKMKARHYRQD